MRRIAGVVLAALLAAFVVAASAAAQEDEGVDPGELRIDRVLVANYPEVTAVVDAPPSPVADRFGARDFQVLEDGEEVPFSVEPVATSSLEVMLVIDVSGSMAGAPITAAKAAAIEFVRAMPPQVQVGAVSFGSAVELMHEPTAAHDEVVARIDALFVSGETALYDAVVFAADQFGDTATDRAMIILSDGGDTVSQGTLADAQAAVQGIRTEVIELVTFESDPEVLAQIAAAGGGAVSSTDDPSGLAELYRLSAEALANQYRIRYDSTGSGVVDLTVRLTALDTGVLEDSTRVELPVASAPTSDFADAEAGAGAPAGTATGAPTVWLVIGAAAFFGVLLVIGLLATSGDPTRRRVRAGLGLRRRTVSLDRETAIQLKDRTSAAMDRFLARQGRQSSVESALDVAGISLRPGEFVSFVAVATLAGVLIGAVLGKVLGAALLLILVPLIARAVVTRRAARRREQFAEQLPDSLQLLTSSLRAGYGFMQALDAVARDASEPSAGEFQRVIMETRVGRDVRDSLRALAERMQSQDLDWVVGAVEINQDVGGDLAEILDTVGDTIRERQRLHRQIRTLSAEGRISAVVLTLLPPGLALFMAVVNPDYFAGLTTGGGLVAVMIGAGLLGLGWIWMSRMIKIEY